MAHSDRAGIAAPLSLVLAAILTLAAAGQNDPAIEVISPGDGAFVSGPVRLQARVVPDNAERQVVRMVFFADGTSVCVVSTRPFMCAWDAGRLVREHQIRIVAELADGRRLVKLVRTKGVEYKETSSVSAVQITATVTDGRGFVGGLRASDFEVREAESLQKVTGFAAEQVDVAVALALDTSGSMTQALPHVKEQSKQFLRLLPERWSKTVLSFNERTFTVAPPSADAETRTGAIDRIAAWGGTALYTAILTSLERVASAPVRKAIVVFTDGADRDSNIGVEDVRKAVDESDAVVYFVASGGAANPGPTLSLLEEIAEASGGRVLRGRDPEALATAFASVREELTHQYLLTYVPERLAPAGTWRAIGVKVSCRGCKVRARRGYRVSR